jgi:hypothetical protein
MTKKRNLAVMLNGPSRRLKKASQDTQQGGFAGPVRANKA